MATAVPPPPAAAINRDILAVVPRIGIRFAESIAISASFVINCILEHAAGGPPRHPFDQWLSLTFGANRQMVTDAWTIVMRRTAARRPSVSLEVLEPSLRLRGTGGGAAGLRFF